MSAAQSEIRIVEARREHEGVIPPHDLDAEASVISAALYDPKQIDRIAFLTPDCFYSEAHRRIFEGIREVHEQVGDRLDVTLVAAHLKRIDRIAQVGGMTYLLEILACAKSVRSIVECARIVMQRARVRRLIGLCQQSAANGYGEHGDDNDYISGVHRAVEDLALQGHTEAIEKNLDTMRRLVKQIGEVAKKRSAGLLNDGVTGIPCGISGVDALTHGWHSAQVVVIAARMGVGKTALGMQFASHAASLGIGVGVFSLEMTRDEILMREISRLSRVDNDQIATGALGMGEWSRLNDAAAKISTMPIQIDDTASLTIDDITSRAIGMIDRGQREGHPIGMFVVDYTQFVSIPQRLQRERRDLQVGNTINGLKLLAKKTGLPVIALAQLNRQVDQRTGQVRWPRRSDIADSDMIARTADKILFIHREAKIEGDENAEHFAEDHKATLILDKQRGGKVGVVPCRFRGEYSHFEQWEERYT